MGGGECEGSGGEGGRTIGAEKRGYPEKGVGKLCIGDDVGGDGGTSGEMEGAPIDGLNGGTVSGLGESQGGHRVSCEEVVDEGEFGGTDEDGGCTRVNVLGVGVGFGGDGYLEGRHRRLVGGFVDGGVDR